MARSYKTKLILACLFAFMAAYTVTQLPQIRYYFSEIISSLKPNKYAEQEYELAKAIAHLERRLEKVKEVRLTQRTVYKLISYIDRNLSPGMTLKSIDIANKPVVTIEGQALRLDDLLLFTRKLEFSFNFFKEVDVSFTQLNEQDPINFTIKSTFGTHYDFGAFENLTNTTIENTLKVTQAEQQEWLDSLQKQQNDLQELIPTERKEMQVLEACKQLASDSNLLISQPEFYNKDNPYSFSVNWGRAFEPKLKLIGRYGDLYKFLAKVFAYKRILAISSLHISFLNQKEKESLIDADINIFAFHATEKELLFEPTKQLEPIPSVRFSKENYNFKDNHRDYFLLGLFYPYKTKNFIALRKVKTVESPIYSTYSSKIYNPLALKALEIAQVKDVYLENKMELYDAQQAQTEAEYLSYALEKLPLCDCKQDCCTDVEPCIKGKCEIFEPIEQEEEEDTEEAVTEGPDVVDFSTTYKTPKGKPFSNTNPK